MKKSLILIALIMILVNVAVAQKTTSKMFVGVWEFERIELLVGDATLTEADKELKLNAEKKFIEQLQGKTISFTSKKCNEQLFGFGEAKWSFDKDNQQLYLEKQVLVDGKKLKDVIAYEANIKDGQLSLKPWTLASYIVYLKRKS